MFVSLPQHQIIYSIKHEINLQIGTEIESNWLAKNKKINKKQETRKNERS